jgi:hypothetical protein
MMPKGIYVRPWQPDPAEMPKLTMNVERASVVRDPKTGLKHDRQSEVFQKCLNRLKR